MLPKFSSHGVRFAHKYIHYTRVGETTFALRFCAETKCFYDRKKVKANTILGINVPVACLNWCVCRWNKEQPRVLCNSIEKGKGKQVAIVPGGLISRLQTANRPPV